MGNCHRVRTVCYGAAPGTTTPGIVAFRIATTTRRITATTISASASVRPPSSIESRIASTEQVIVRFSHACVRDKKPKGTYSSVSRLHGFVGSKGLLFFIRCAWFCFRCMGRPRTRPTLTHQKFHPPRFSQNFYLARGIVDS